MRERKVVVRLADGLHARPATQFVKLARSFASTVLVWKTGKSADAKSSVKLMLLGVKQDEDVLLTAEGVDEVEALAKLGDFVSASEPDGEATPPPVKAAAGAPSGLSGVPASEGVALGPVFGYFRKVVTAPRRSIGAEAVAAERERLSRASEAVCADLRLRATDGEDGEIARALEELALDPELQRRAGDAVASGLDATSAILDAAGVLAAEFESLADPYLAARGEDVRGVAQSIALALAGERQPSLADAPPGAIVVADEIDALDLLGAPLGRIAGLIARKGGATSHVAIIARAHGVPAVLGVAVDAERLRAAKEAAIDGGTGAVALDPSPEVRQAYAARIGEAEAEKARLAEWRHVEPRTRDGRLIQLAANIGSAKDAPAALAAGAMGVGLFRTELLFMQRKRPPSEDEQAEIYAEVARAFAPHAVIVRTLDVGGDKHTPGIVVPREENPFLGWRGVRLTLDRPDIFKPQLRALLRAAVVGNIKVMIPMVATVDEILAVKALVAICEDELRAEGRPFASFELGVMVETPAAVFIADALAAEVAFFSIGTNDLTQYVMAADRQNEKVALLNRAENPAVLKAVEMVCEAAKRRRIWVGVCGEAAARPDLIETFVRFGVTELSMSAASLARAKRCVLAI